MSIQIRNAQASGGIAVWGFAAADKVAGSASPFASIEFAEWTPPMEVLSSDF